jgi:hypothetical protein
MDYADSCHIPGGSFGTVYKAIERVTGEIVAIKHVSVNWLLQCGDANGMVLNVS